MRKGATKIVWTIHEKIFILRNWETIESDDELTKLLNEKFGNNRSVKSVKVYRSERLGLVRGPSVIEKIKRGRNAGK